MEIVDSISEHQGNIVDDFISIKKIVLQHFIATVRIDFNGSNGVIWQRGDNQFHFGDMLLGPVYFQARTEERMIRT